MLEWILSVHATFANGVFLALLLGCPALLLFALYAGVIGNSRWLKIGSGVLISVAFLFWFATFLYDGSAHARGEQGHFHFDNQLLGLLTLGLSIAAILFSFAMYKAVNWLQRRNG